MRTSRKFWSDDCRQMMGIIGSSFKHMLKLKIPEDGYYYLTVSTKEDSILIYSRQRAACDYVIGLEKL